MITLLLLLFPLLAGLFLLFSKKSSSAFVANFSLIASLAQLLLFGVALNQFLSQKGSLVFNTPWVKDYGINFHLAWDGLGAIMIGLTCSIILLIVLALNTLNYKDKFKLFGLLFLTQASLIGVFTAKDIFVFYFFFEITLLPVYLMANFWGGANASKITFKMLVYTIFGSLFMLVAFVLLYMRTQTSDIDSIKTTISILPKMIQHFAFWSFVLAFAIKMPIFPLHTWLPNAYSQSPTPASMLMSGLLSKMGVFGLLRILLPLAPSGIETYSPPLILLSIIGLIYGSIIAIKQDNSKKLIAYSSFAHLGIMAGAVFTCSVEGIQGAIFQMVAHAFNAIGLFYIAKLIFDRTGSRSLQQLGGITQQAPQLSVAFMVILLSSVALPLTNGFVGEFLMLKSLFDYNLYVGILAAISIILGAVYMLRYFQKSMFGPSSEHTHAFKDLTTKEWLVLAPIMAVILVTGLFPSLILEITEPFVNGLAIVGK
jgi:NADH-quinone oxidoreductase subunit M